MMQPQALLLPPVHLSSTGINYSSAFLRIGLGLQKVHKIWQVYMHSKILANTDHWLSLLFGRTFDHYFGHNPLTKIITIPLFVTIRLLDLMEQEDTVIKSFGRLKLAMRGIQPVPQPTNKISGFKFSLSKYRFIQYKHNISTFTQRLQRVCYSVFDLLKQIFFLVMRFMDILELLSSDQSIIEEHMHRAVQEGVINLERVVEVISTNNQNIRLRIKQLENVITENTSFSYNPILQSIEFLNIVERKARPYKKAAMLTGSNTRIILKKALLDLLPVDFRNSLGTPELLAAENPYKYKGAGPSEDSVAIAVKMKSRQKFNDFCFP